MEDVEGFRRPAVSEASRPLATGRTWTTTAERPGPRAAGGRWSEASDDEEDPFGKEQWDMEPFGVSATITAAYDVLPLLRSSAHSE